MKARIDTEPNQIVIREKWEEAFRLMAERGDDAFAEEPPSLTAFDEVEWKW